MGGVTRADAKLGGWRFKSVAGQEDTMTTCEYLVKTDLKGWIPGFLVNMVTSNQPLLIAKVRKVLLSDSNKESLQEYLPGGERYVKGLKRINVDPKYGGRVKSTPANVSSSSSSSLSDANANANANATSTSSSSEHASPKETLTLPPRRPLPPQPLGLHILLHPALWLGVAGLYPVFNFVLAHAPIIINFL